MKVSCFSSRTSDKHFLITFFNSVGTLSVQL
jgi:hypothetical protein